MNEADLAAYVGSHTDDTAFVSQCWNEATDLVTAFIGTQIVPESIKDRAILETGSELFHRRNSPQGLAQMAAFDGSPVRVARDPMVGAYPILAKAMVINL